ncbi:putative N-acetylmuramoyl-L-alanine amidase [Rubrivivax sp. A210]|uniref:peptidoglycan recognition protein family protein n=1 Tax=Rubrivivax sp. A210 TaxID=2772301 RepID=UPI001918EEE5|nr:N-acetylmuramoyl-L-alanine amidase [Rubrivivax sp. A210]CAD5374117.1 putative N-acetylmuramoyl-L-alanine amidase [Rubrivivax sp. A210]
MGIQICSTGHGEVDGLMRRASSLRALSASEIARLIKGMYAIPVLDPRRLSQAQSLLRGLGVRDPAVCRQIEAFARLDFARFMHRVLTRPPEPRRAVPAVPYRIDHIPSSAPKQRRPGKALIAKYLTIHSTGNPNSSARNERSWLTNTANDREASFHVVVDESEAVECIPLDEVAWHAGSGNHSSISLEICESGDRAKTLRNAVAVAARLLAERKLGTQQLLRHADWMSKNCPRILIDKDFRADKSQTWEWFTSEVGALL